MHFQKCSSQDCQSQEARGLSEYWQCALGRAHPKGKFQGLKSIYSSCRFFLIALGWTISSRSGNSFNDFSVVGCAAEEKGFSFKIISYFPSASPSCSRFSCKPINLNHWWTISLWQWTDGCCQLIYSNFNRTCSILNCDQGKKPSIHRRETRKWLLAGISRHLCLYCL